MPVLRQRLSALLTALCLLSFPAMSAEADRPSIRPLAATLLKRIEAHCPDAPGLGQYLRLREIASGIGEDGPLSLYGAIQDVMGADVASGCKEILLSNRVMGFRWLNRLHRGEPLWDEWEGPVMLAIALLDLQLHQGRPVGPDLKAEVDALIAQLRRDEVPRQVHNLPGFQDSSFLLLYGGRNTLWSGESRNFRPLAILSHVDFIQERIDRALLVVLAAPDHIDGNALLSMKEWMQFLRQTALTQQVLHWPEELPADRRKGLLKEYVSSTEEMLRRVEAGEVIHEMDGQVSKEKLATRLAQLHAALGDKASTRRWLAEVRNDSVFSLGQCKEGIYPDKNIEAMLRSDAAWRDEVVGKHCRPRLADAKRRAALLPVSRMLGRLESGCSRLSGNSVYRGLRRIKRQGWAADWEVRHLLSGPGQGPGAPGGEAKCRLAALSNNIDSLQVLLAEPGEGVVPRQELLAIRAVNRIEIALSSPADEAGGVLEQDAAQIRAWAETLHLRPDIGGAGSDFDSLMEQLLVAVQWPNFLVEQAHHNAVQRDPVQTNHQRERLRVIDEVIRLTEAALKQGGLGGPTTRAIRKSALYMKAALLPRGTTAYLEALQAAEDISSLDMGVE